MLMCTTENGKSAVRGRACACNQQHVAIVSHKPKNSLVKGKVCVSRTGKDVQCGWQAVNHLIADSSLDAQHGSGGMSGR